MLEYAYKMKNKGEKRDEGFWFLRRKKQSPLQKCKGLESRAPKKIYGVKIFGKEAKPIEKTNTPNDLGVLAQNRALLMAGVERFARSGATE